MDIRGEVGAGVLMVIPSGLLDGGATECLGGEMRASRWLGVPLGCRPGGAMRRHALVGRRGPEGEGRSMSWTARAVLCGR